MRTRKQYMDGECTHDEYYAQFVTEQRKQIVLNRLKLEELKAHFKASTTSTPPHPQPPTPLPHHPGGWGCFGIFGHSMIELARARNRYARCLLL